MNFPSLDGDFLPCDICGSRMRMQKEANSYGDGTAFSCSSCEQKWHFTETNGTCRIMRSIWGEKIPRHLKNEFIKDWIFKEKFRAKSRFLSGMLSKDGYKDLLIEIADAVEQYLGENPCPKWWEFWK